ncbi:MAG: hypothetical protein RAO94_00375 [Candidatus Stygibacter australis]|nr:hypothetical protein [Candidatus Stygibacter australis]MDP8320781.1 hypothetical protein [Candidatus Stygibacter australis]
MKKWIFIVIVVLLMFLGCSLPQNPGLPTWDTKLSFYVLNDSYDLLELAEEDSSIVLTENAVGDTVLGIYQENLNEQEIDIGQTEPVFESDTAEIGDIAISDVDPIQGGITFGEFASAANLDIPGQGVEVPEIVSFSFEDISIELEPVNEIQWVEIMSGGFDLEIINNMIIGLGNYQVGEYLTLSLVHENDGGVWENVIDDIILEDRNLAPGENYTTSIDLEGIVLYRDMQLLISGGSRGTDGNSVVIVLEDQLETNISFWDDLKASAAEALIAEQTIEDTVSIELDEDYHIYEATLADNPDYQLSIHVENGIDVALHLHVDIPALFLDSEENYQADYEIPRSSEGGMFDEILELGGARLGDGTELLSDIEIFIVANIDSTDVDDYRQINASDSYLVEAELSELEFEYVRGIIEPQEQESISDEITLDVDYPEVQEGGQFIFVGDSEIRIDLSTGNSQIPGDLVIDVRAFNTENEMVQLINIESGEIPQIEIPASTSFSIEFNSDVYNINELLSLLPVLIEFEVQVTAGDGVSELIYHQGDLLTSNIILESTLSLATDAWVIPRQDGEIVISEEDVELKQEEFDAFQSASLKLTYINTTGMQVGAEVLLSDSENNIMNEIYHYENPDTSIVDLIVMPGLETTLEGETKELMIDLNQKDLSYFLKDLTYVASRINLVSDGEHALAGEIQLVGMAEIIIRISQDLIDNGEE